MKLGISTPVVVQVPGAASEWERGAGIDDIAQIAEAADRLGFHHLTCSEHVAVPTDVAKVRGATYWDPLATLGYLAARTRHIRLATNVLVLGYHHPLAIAKRYGTLDVVSGGRLILGVGVGTLQAEFDLLRAPFDGRGERADDAMQALRASLSRPTPEYHGSHYDFEGFVVEPHAMQTHVPLWVGGRSRASLRRAVTYGDGWTPFGLDLGTYRSMLDDVDLPDGFAVVLPTERSVDPMTDPHRTIELLMAVRDAGATHVQIRIRSDSARHYVEQLTALDALARTERLVDDP